MSQSHAGRRAEGGAIPDRDRRSRRRSRCSPPQRARYVIVDWELPFRDGADGSLAGRFQNLADWAGIPTSRYYSLCFSRATDADPWQPTWIFREAVLPVDGVPADGARRRGGARRRTTPMSSRSRERTDTTGRQFCEVVEPQAVRDAPTRPRRRRRNAAPDSRRSASRRGSPRFPCRRSPACARWPSSATPVRRQTNHRWSGSSK